jgi:Protein of unknown function (DUF2911)
MRTLFLLILLSIFTFSCKQEAKAKSNEANHENHKLTTDKEETTPKKVLSPHTETMAMIGDAHIHIDYSSPGVRGRIIFGGLVGYDQVWQAGAHRATWLETNKDLVIDGKMLPAGKYGLFAIPSKDEWTIMLNSNWDQHGKDEYSENEDVVRFKVKPVISDEVTEHLIYTIDSTSDDEGSITLAWEKVTVNFNVNMKH